MIVDSDEFEYIDGGSEIKRKRISLLRLIVYHQL